MKKDYTIEDAIHDLKALQDFFEQESGGCCPICLDFAIKKLKQMQKNEKAVLNIIKK